MALARCFNRMILIGVVAVAALASTTSHAAARDLSAMTGEDIWVLQQRLADAGCYKGPIDGKAN
ncbi:MAG: peptidoglycan-binding domain-containing protein, partial [Beijerinckiaceae bacterium]